MILFAQSLKRQEEKNRVKEFESKGTYLVSLISLYPIKDIRNEKSDFFLRTLSEYTSGEGFLYLFVQDLTGKSLISMAPHDNAWTIPDEVRTRSLYTMELTRQTFKIAGTGDQVYEFAKPIFEGDKKIATLRLGLKLPSSSFITLERVSLLAMIAFFIFAAVSLEYYGITLALKPLRNLKKNFGPIASGAVTRVDEPPKGGQIGPVIKDLEMTLLRIGDKLNQFQRENTDLSSRLGLSIFEKNQIARILDSIHFGIIIMDAQDHVTHVNDFMLKFLNRKREDILDHPLQEVLIHDEIRYVLSQWEAMGQGGNANHLEVSFPEVAPGEIFQISFSHVADSDKSPLCKMIFLRNITSEKLSDEANHKFIAHVAHELFTPLTNIKSYNEMLMDGEVKDGEMQKEFYNTINEETNRLSRLIQNLLDISKIEMGSLTINKGLVRTDWFVDSCMSPIEASARDKKITLVKNLPDTFPFLIADKELLKAAIINILGNAVKYTPKNGKITYSIYEQDNMVVFDVIDTGYGISEEDLAHVFEKFYRSQDPQITAQAGSGLGMAIASEIVHLHDGEIDVKSKPGEGTYFTIRIPKEDYQVGKQ